ncbi:MAG TPA: HEAT repeat domain-containing protein [Mycobacteriales bacterium]|nr:HEAT repeat domain-containing protein [Mycobacteriales bacterium]
MSLRPLVTVLQVEAAVVVLAVVALVAEGARTTFARRRAPRLERARRSVSAAVHGDGGVQDAPRQLRALPRRLALPVLTELADSLSGAALRRLRLVAAETGAVREARRSCRSRLWWRRLHGLRLLARIGTADDLVARLLDDPHEAVRAAAADAAGPAPATEVVRRLLAMLDDPRPGCRFCAQTGLLRAGTAAGDAIEAYLADPDAPRLADVLEIAAAAPQRRFVLPALAAATHPDVAVRACGAGLCTAVGGGEAAAALVGLLDDPAPEVRAAAAHGLGRLGEWRSAGALAELLGDRSWDVRYAAGTALRRLRGPGRLFLRRALGHADPFAADMARRMLDLPDGTVEAAR